MISDILDKTDFTILKSYVEQNKKHMICKHIYLKGLFGRSSKFCSVILVEKDLIRIKAFGYPLFNMNLKELLEELVPGRYSIEVEFVSDEVGY